MIRTKTGLHKTFMDAIEAEWKVEPSTVDHLGLENVLVAILRSQLPHCDKCGCMKEAIDAFTMRGHFDKSEYPPDHEHIKYWACESDREEP